MKYGNTGTEIACCGLSRWRDPSAPSHMCLPVSCGVVDESMTKIVTAECLLAPGSHLIIQGADA